ncbi:MAG: divalent cation tolerance protein CutA [Eubacteriales bacterium]|nr:divalent cation tolerance protein CutA [Eubacteriales bacterium]
MVKIECYIPGEYVGRLKDELNKTGALTVGLYDYCMAVSKVRGSWRPLEGSSPHEGETGKICEAEEAKIGFTCKKDLCGTAVQTIKNVHPYETPVINVIPLICE